LIKKFSCDFLRLMFQHLQPGRGDSMKSSPGCCKPACFREDRAARLLRTPCWPLGSNSLRTASLRWKWLARCNHFTGIMFFTVLKKARREAYRFGNQVWPWPISSFISIADHSSSPRMAWAKANLARDWKQTINTSFGLPVRLRKDWMVSTATSAASSRGNP
jgi:hypothetical protein